MEYIYEQVNYSGRVVDTFVKLQARVNNSWRLPAGEVLRVYGGGNRTQIIAHLTNMVDIQSWLNDKEVAMSMRVEAAKDHNYGVGGLIYETPTPPPDTYEEELARCSAAFKPTPAASNQAMLAASNQAMLAASNQAMPAAHHKLTWDPLEDMINQPMSNPKEFIMDLEWIEAMQYMPNFKDPERFLAALELTLRRHLDHMGEKNPRVKDCQKVIWYMKFYTAYLIAGRPIRINEVDAILNS